MPLRRKVEKEKKNCNFTSVSPMLVSRKSKTSTLLNPNLVARAVYAKHSPILTYQCPLHILRATTMRLWHDENEEIITMVVMATYGILGA